MLPAVSILLFSVFAAVFEGRMMRKHKMKRELVVYIILLTFATTFCIAQALHLPIPNPADGIIMIFEPISDAMDNLLGVRRK